MKRYWSIGLTANQGFLLRKIVYLWFTTKFDFWTSICGYRTLIVRKITAFINKIDKNGNFIKNESKLVNYSYIEYKNWNHDLWVFTSRKNRQLPLHKTITSALMIEVKKKRWFSPHQKVLVVIVRLHYWYVGDTETKPHTNTQQSIQKYLNTIHVIHYDYFTVGHPYHASYNRDCVNRHIHG